MNAKTTATGCRPFLKWAGGKRKQAVQIAAKMPQRIEHLAIPFLGAGGVFWHLVSTDRIAGPVLLSDADRNLIELWQVVQAGPEEMLRICAEWTRDLHASADPEGVYYFVRGKPKKGHPPPRSRWRPKTKVERAARHLWLNRHCNNGLWRFSGKGEFNVGWCHDPKRAGIDADNVRRCHEALNDLTVLIRCMDFRATLDTDALPRDAVVYMDPPYDGVDFDEYGAGAFGANEQDHVADRARALVVAGAECVIVSNNDTPRVRRLFERLPGSTTQVRLERVMAPRSINSDGDGRGKVAEVQISLRPKTLYAGWDSSPTHSALVVLDDDGDVAFQRQLVVRQGDQRPPHVQAIPTNLAGAQRLAWIGRWYRETIAALATAYPDTRVFCGVENYAPSSGTNRGKTLTFECGGLLRAAIAAADWRLKLVPVSLVKKHATGSGAAGTSKADVADGAQRRWGWQHDPSNPNRDDLDDARVIAELIHEVRRLQTGVVELDELNPRESKALQAKYREVFTGAKSTPKHKRRNLITEEWL